MGNVLKPLAISVLAPLRLTAASAAADAGMYKKTIGSGMAALIILIKEMNVISKIMACLRESGLLVEGGSKTIK